jgi:hypothetical protein
MGKNLTKFKIKLKDKAMRKKRPRRQNKTPFLIQQGGKRGGIASN